MARRILITGSSRGIGRAIAEELAKDGFDIAVHYKSNLTAAQESIEKIKVFGRKATLLQFDVCDYQQSSSVIEKDMEDNGVYYGVVCNAGITADGPLPALSQNDWLSVINTNLNSFYNVLHPIIMPMVQTRQPGRIVTISSYSGIIGNRGQSNYSAAKAGVIAATKSLAKELAKRSITVNCVAPGLIETDLSEESATAEMIKIIPMRRAGKPEEVSSLISYLMSDKASYITGEVISVTGGLT